MVFFFNDTKNFSEMIKAVFFRIHQPEKCMTFCYIIAEGFRFMPLGLVRLGTFRLSTWVS